MIDFIKGYIPSEQVESTRGCDLQTIDINDGDLKGNPFGMLGNMKLSHQKIGLFISGSIHSYFNDSLLGYGLGNSNDFDFIQIIQCLDVLIDKTGVDWNKAKLTQLEFGFNLATRKPVDEIIQSIRLYDKRAVSSLYNNKSRCSKFFELSNYYVLKVYNKGKHKKLNDNILRIEVRMYPKKLKELKLNSINALRQQESYHRMFAFLMQCIEKLVFVDKTIGISGISPEEEILLRSGISADYWSELRHMYSRTTVKRQFDKFQNIISKHNLDTSKVLVKKALKDKFELLLDKSNKFLLYNNSK
jgi:hypothetical protein